MVGDARGGLALRRPLVVVVGERGVEVRIVHRRTVVDGHEVDEAGRGERSDL